MEEYIKPILSQAGLAGGLLILYYYFVGRRLLAVEEAIRIMVEAKLLSLASNPNISPEVKQEAASLIEKNSDALKVVRNQ